jgi:hypothetical protein
LSLPRASQASLEPPSSLLLALRSFLK